MPSLAKNSACFLFEVEGVEGPLQVVRFDLVESISGLFELEADLACVDRELDIDDFLDLRQEPGIDMGDLMDLVQAETLCKRIAHVPDALGATRTTESGSTTSAWSRRCGRCCTGKTAVSFRI